MVALDGSQTLDWVGSREGLSVAQIYWRFLIFFKKIIYIYIYIYSSICSLVRLEAWVFLRLCGVSSRSSGGELSFKDIWNLVEGLAVASGAARWCFGSSMVHMEQRRQQQHIGIKKVQLPVHGGLTSDV